MIRRARRISRKPPAEIAFLARRELAGRAAARRSDRALGTRGDIAVGPFIGEVGFELLYWIPLLRRFLRERGVDPARVTAITRGGAGAWYDGVASHTVEIFDLVDPDVYVRELFARRAWARDQKQLTVAPLDRRLVQRAGAAGVPLVHPALMYERLRDVWAGRRPVADALAFLDHRPLPSSAAAPWPDIPRGYVVFKPYFSDCFPETAANRAFLARLLDAIAERHPVVSLATELLFDDHADWQPPRGGRVLRVGDRLDPRDNLAVQTAVVANARALVSTYGGFSYLGPLLGVPTLAVHSTRDYVPAHFELQRAVGLTRGYVRADVSDGDAVGAFTHALDELAEAVA